ncbi:hypothetical protein PoB_003569500 [Plakobranchus ocellatus]|uniref:Uncharacterized protein n=1 Tax=Plakobranchus ocellatus TaxID=259542 RepID=A0AAV4ALW6_9GAST|nr:hypothetical protein PoB_003569500 [Plakobranchus ocellatus]
MVLALENVYCGHGRSRRTNLNRPPQTGASGPHQTSPPARRGRPPALPVPSSATETDDNRGHPLAQTHHRQLTSHTGRQVRLPVRFQ